MKLHLRAFAKEIFGLDTPLAGILALEAWFNKIETPTRLSQFDIREDQFDALADTIVRHAQLFGNSETYTKDVSLEILHLAK
ncbi:hypothetical protein P4S72_13900 [Vibrio sp. PP-XX7]